MKTYPEYCQVTRSGTKWCSEVQNKNGDIERHFFLSKNRAILRAALDAKLLGVSTELEVK